MTTVPSHAQAEAEHDNEVAGEAGLTTFPWYKDFLSRNKAEQMFSSAKEGPFLIRSSSRAPEPAVSFIYCGTI